MSSGAKEKILAKIQLALQQETSMPFEGVDVSVPVYNPPDTDLAIAFAESFIALQGQFAFCLSITELKEQLSQYLERKKWHWVYCADPILRNLLRFDWYEDLASCKVSITGCDALVARTGSIVLSSAQQQGRTASVYAPAHICIAYTSQLVADVDNALSLLQVNHPKGLPSLISFAGGPSRTADIEKTLVTGVHGPREVFCYLIEG
jgi:L-lactate dehydrogenase complex protein LldG